MKKIIFLILACCSSAYAQNYQWVQPDGGYSEDKSFGITTDSSGNVYVTGFFKSTATFGTSVFSSAGVEDVFLVKYDPTGAFLWAKQFGGPSIDIGYDVAVDALGNCYVTGSFMGQSVFGNVTLQSSGISDYDAFLVKVDPAGNILWARHGGGSSWDESRGIALSGENVYISGNFTGPATFDSVTVTGGQDVYVASYDLSGNVNWVVTGGGDHADFANGLAADPAGNLYATGYFQGQASFGTHQVANASNLYIDMFVTKLDSGGTFLWAKRGGAVGDDDAGRAITTDELGNVYVAGEIRNSGNFENLNYTVSGIADMFVAKYNTSGNLEFMTHEGNGGGNYGYGIAATSSNVYVTGLYNGIISFGPTTLDNPGSNGIYFAKLSSQNGVFTGAIAAGGTGNDAGRAVALDNSGAVYQTGEFEHSPSTFGPFSLNTAGARDIFIAKVNPSSLGIANFQSTELQVSPNPSNGRFELALPRETETEITIVSLLGQVIFRKRYSVSESGSIAVDFTAPPGIYVVNALNEDRVLIEKIVIR